MTGTKVDKRTELEKQSKPLKDKKKTTFLSPSVYSELLIPSNHELFCAEHLHSELLMRIFDFLTLTDLSSAMCVCKVWHQVGNHNYVWSSRTRSCITKKKVISNTNSTCLSIPLSHIPSTSIRVRSLSITLPPLASLLVHM